MNTQEKRLKILITGEPGSGGSTLAANLMTELRDREVVKISGGRFRRAEAHHWATFKEEMANIDAAQTWLHFEQLYETTYAELGINGVIALLSPYFELPSDDGILLQMDDDQKLYCKNHDIWETMTDCFLLDQIYNVDQNLVLESKLAVVLDVIDQLAQHVDTSAALPLIKIILRVDPEVAAERISIRQNSPISVEQVKSRSINHWERYGNLYTSQNEPLSQNIVDQQGFLIDTSNITAQQVLDRAITYILLHVVDSPIYDVDTGDYGLAAN